MLATLFWLAVREALGGEVAPVGRTAAAGGESAAGEPLSARARTLLGSRD